MIARRSRCPVVRRQMSARGRNSGLVVAISITQPTWLCPRIVLSPESPLLTSPAGTAVRLVAYALTAALITEALVRGASRGWFAAIGAEGGPIEYAHYPYAVPLLRVRMRESALESPGCLRVGSLRRRARSDS